MRIKTKALAIATVAAMLASSVNANAADPIYTGDGTVENNDSTAPAYDHVVLPTMSDNAYDFTLDPTGLLHQYNPADYEVGSVYFNSQDSAATLVNKEGGTTTDGKLYYSSKSASTVDALKAKLTATDDAVSAIDGDFYLWIPDSTVDGLAAGLGTYEKITLANLSTYFDVACTGTTVDSFALKTSHAAGACVCDGTVYTDSYAELPVGYTATDYVTIAAGAIDTTKTINLAVTLDAGSTYTAITSANVDTYVTYTAATAKYQSNSDSTLITNKSTKDKTVTAKVTLKNAGTLNFNSTSTFGESTGTDVYFAINDGANAEPVTKDVDSGIVSASTTFNLSAPVAAPITYQTDDVDPLTGGHVYKQYEAANVAYNSTSFYIEGAANTSAEADWSEYVEAMTAETRPSLEVVYTIADVSAEPEVTDDYVMTLAEGDISYTFVDAPVETTITALTVDGVSKIAAYTANNVTYSGGILTFNSTAASGTGLVMTRGSHTIVATFGESDERTLTFNYTGDDYIMALESGSVTYTFTDAPANDTITTLTVDGVTKIGAVTALNVTFASGTLTFNPTAASGTGLLTTGTHTVVATIGGTEYTFTFVAE